MEPTAIHATLDIKTAKKLVGMMNIAFDDYRAARLLYLNGCLLQATILANTCIEKLLKALLIFSSKDPGFVHDTIKLHEMAEEVSPVLASFYNKDYLRTISNIYKARYIGDQPPNYNFVIVQNKFLVELDGTAFLIFHSLRLNNFAGIDNPHNKFHEAINSRDPIILTNNAKYGLPDRTTLITSPQIILEVRVAEKGIMLEIEYISKEVKDDHKFSYEALGKVKGVTHESSHPVHEVLFASDHITPRVVPKKNPPTG